MDKKQFEIQVMHNYFMRFAIVSVCKIILWAIAYSFCLSAISWITTAIISSANEVSNNATKVAQATEAAGVLSVFFTTITAIIFFLIFISIITKIISEHKKVSQAEDAFLKR